MLDQIVSWSISTLLLTTIPYALSRSMDFLVMALGFWYGSQLIASGEYASTQFFLIFMNNLFAEQAVAILFIASGSLTKFKSATNQLLRLRETRPTLQGSGDAQGKQFDGNTQLSFQDVHLNYSQRSTQVLQGVSIDIAPGQFVGLVGPSGSGKSTLLNLFERHYDPNSGPIQLGPSNLHRISVIRYREHASLVQQEPALLQDTVKEKITLRIDFEPSEEAVHDAARQANTLDFIVSLPEGFWTQCGANGVSFSGGQKQPRAIARALIRKPKILLLDEATSALDTESKKLVQEALYGAENTDGRTVAAVAHRLSMLHSANVIFVAVGGRVVESGTHHQPYQLKGLYYEMCLAQSVSA